jgi:hypothetical protein
MKSRGSVWVIRMWCRISINPVIRCYVDPEGLNYGNLVVGVLPELMSWLTV